MSKVSDEIEIVSIDGPWDIRTRMIVFDYNETRYWITLDYHERYGYECDWFDESKNKIEKPAWVGNDGVFYSEIGEMAREL